MTTPIVVVGAGGFGREVIDVVEAVNAAAQEPVWELLGVLDDALSPDNRDRLTRRSVAHLGSVSDFVASKGGAVSYAVGIGSPSVRRRIARILDEAGHSGATLVHPSVTTGAEVSVGAGSVLCAGVRITTNVTIGEHVHLNLNATVGHDASIGDFVSINPLASISGDCVIESEVLVGVGGLVLNGITIGWGATVGGGACVVRDVAPETTVVGIPARPLAPR